jgi:hypothetical protein
MLFRPRAEELGLARPPEVDSPFIPIDEQEEVGAGDRAGMLRVHVPPPADELSVRDPLHDEVAARIDPGDVVQVGTIDP